MDVLALVIDLYSRRVVAGHIDKRMTIDLEFHRDTDSQYTSKRFRYRLASDGARTIHNSKGGPLFERALLESEHQVLLIQTIHQLSFSGNNQSPAD
ncbi:hypothetical protein [Agarivorans sp. QJM3NY_25]|uniref:hypothetical protein n=1 Tax=Agarivorans sp. QJM3NY_25 TaxID=3421430 RepID=UPI003D7CB5F1